MVGEPNHTDQGSQFTSEAFTSRPLGAGVQVSMDGRGRAYDNIIGERFWRNVKHEHLYLHAAGTGRELHQGIHDYMEFYNHRRVHESLDYATPDEVYQKEIVA
jgi:putative transposase